MIPLYLMPIPKFAHKSLMLIMIPLGDILPILGMANIIILRRNHNL